MQSPRSVYMPALVNEALSALQTGAIALAGGTWIMRAPLRGQALGASYVSLRGLEGIRAIEFREAEIAIGAAVTHFELAAALKSVPDCAGLAQAAAQAANPAVRHAATLGGNLCAVGFAASDLVPALLAAGGEVEIRTACGVERKSFEAFLASRASLQPGWLLTRVFASRSSRRSAHARLPLRQAGDYPVAIVSASVNLTRDKRIASARIAVGSVEPAARRWPALEQALEGRALDPDSAAEWARERLRDFTGRDGVEAPGWYRTQVLPSLVRSAFQSLQTEA